MRRRHFYASLFVVCQQARSGEVAAWGWGLGMRDLRSGAFDRQIGLAPAFHSAS